ncbi:spk-1 [Symbiodinium sp. CCMP2456]|nr:spk-1 [Symbiodinium sp. CCMP2456]
MPPPRRTKIPRKAKGKKKPPAKPVRRSSTRSSSYSESSYGSDGSSSPEHSDEDDPKEYKRGGYHPVMPYQLYNARYRVLSKLGAGAFSTVWLCTDEKDSSQEPRLIAMKVCKSKKSVTEQAQDEVMLLERLHEDGSSPHVVKMLDHFWHTGTNGRHKCMTFEVMGENLLALVRHHNYEGLPRDLCRRLSRHTLKGLQHIHARGVIHTDVKLENVLICRHDMSVLVQEASRAHRAFQEQKSGLETLSKSQKKRMKKKQKAKDANIAGSEDPKTEAAAEEVEAEVAEVPQAEVVNGVNSVNGKGKGDGYPKPEGEVPAAGNVPGEAPPGQPIPPIRQRDRFENLQLEETFAKLADFGNGIKANNPVTDDIQTRQYRSPEVIIGAKWDETADVWSAACMFFELATGDYLFDPKKGEDWNREEDHLALIAELLGDLPTKEFALSGRYSKDFFNNAAKLKHIKKLKMWPLEGVLQEKYRWEEAEALEMADFLLPMLTWQPSQRQAASEALKHAWVQPRNGETDTWPVPQRCDGFEKTEQVSESIQEAPASPTSPEQV